ncbi:MAG: hypothetical protein N2712_01305 [Brevinematales bacterium]|nr:hypothetical protein [Brevinematales bacterium]
MLKNKLLWCFIVFIVFIVSCNFRFDVLKQEISLVTNQKYFIDTLPPFVSLIFPVPYSTISNRVVFVGKTLDDSQSTTYLSFWGTNIVFTNQSEWIFELNTFDLTNGPFTIKVYASDALKNFSHQKEYVFYISNRFEVFVQPASLLITNTDFEFSVYFTSTNYSLMKVYTNGFEYFSTNSVRNLMVPLNLNSFGEYITNYLYVIVDQITNIKSFIFDITPPYLKVLLRTNSYVYGNYFSIPVFVFDTNASRVFVAYSTFTNCYFVTNGTNVLLINTYSLDNGTNYFSFWSSDVAGNVSSEIIIPVLVVNFTSSRLLMETGKNYYFVNGEFISNKIYLLFTDNNFSSFFVSREDNNFLKERVRQSSLNILESGKVRLVYDGKNMILGYIRNDNNLIIRTNLDITNYYQSLSIPSIRDFELVVFSNKTYLIRLNQSNFLTITDISNKTTNFNTNIVGSSLVGADRYPSRFLSYSVCKDQNILVFSNSALVFLTNLGYSVDEIMMLSSSNINYVVLGSSNRIDVLVLSNFSLLTNYVFISNDGFRDLDGVSHNGRIFICIVESVGISGRVRLLEFDMNNVFRNQPLDFTFSSHLFWNDTKMLISDKINIFLPFYDGSQGGFYRIIGL